MQQRKVVIVGAGAVGATYCYALAQSGLADEIVLTDRNEDLMKGQVLDLVHGQSFFLQWLSVPGLLMIIPMLRLL